MKKSLWILALLIGGVAIFAANPKFHLSVSADTVGAGEVFQVLFTVNGNESLEVRSLPKLADGARWLPNRTSRSTRMVNWKTTTTHSVAVLAPTKPGMLEIPPFKVKVGGEEILSPELKVKVVPAGDKMTAPQEDTSAAGGKTEKIKLAEAVFARVELPEQRKSYYVGEEIPIVLRLFVLPRLGVRLVSYPVFENIGNAVFRDYGAANPENRKFAPIDQTKEVELNGKRYDTISFRSALRPVSAGMISPSAKMQLQVPEMERQNQRRSPGGSFFDDDFFDSFFQSSMRRYFPYTVQASSVETLKILPLPRPPDGTHYLGLVGDWKLSCALDQSSPRQGEALTLTLEMRGDGSAETLMPPRPNWKNFRFYPPEIEKQQRGAESIITVKYAVIPLEQGDFSEDLRLSVFNPAVEKYEKKTFPLTLKVEKGLVKPAPLISAGAVAPALDSAALRNGEEPGATTSSTAPREELFYQKIAPGEVVALPLWRNQSGVLTGLALLEFAVVAFAFGGFLMLLRRERDPRYAEKIIHRRALSPLLCRLKKADELDDSLREDMIGFLAGGMELPSGATAADVAEKLPDGDLKKYFLTLENSSFAPGMATQESVRKLSPELRRALMKLLKHFAVVLLLLGVFFPLVAIPASEDGLTVGNAAFDQGKLEEAANAYRAALARGESSAALWYNLGNTEFRLGNLPAARYDLLRALLLSPRDSEIQENLNLVNRKLMLPEQGKTDSPGALLVYCRDRLRPDQHLVLAAGFVVLLTLLAVFRRRLSILMFGVLSAVFGICLLLSVFSITFQAAGPYQASRGVLVGKSIELRSLPGKQIGQVLNTLPGGADAMMLDRRGDWVRIAVDGRDGWVRNADFRLLFSGGALW